jgi:hypothetical protein
MDTVMILLDFGETWTLTECMPRWCAEWELRRIGELGTPYQGKRVTGALIVPCHPESSPSTSDSLH